MTSTSGVGLTQVPGEAELFAEESLVLVADFAKDSSPASHRFCVEFFHVLTGFLFHMVLVVDLLALSIIISVQRFSPLFSLSLAPLCR